MWLLDTSSLKLRCFQSEGDVRYAILSHTWEAEEVSFQEMQSPTDSVRRKAGYKKVKSFCILAKEQGFDWAWADTACIDKQSSAELSEAINSMYRWYREAGRCFIYLQDVSIDDTAPDGPGRLREVFAKSRWFTRGWTLQELLACPHRVFYAADWQELLGKHFDQCVLCLCSKVTRISTAFLDHYHVTAGKSSHPERPCIAERMSWAAYRKTSRPEDIAYCLMGMFGVSMPILYGEGGLAAFRRLQIEIMQTSTDQSLFFWRAAKGTKTGLLARAPSDFWCSAGIVQSRATSFLSPYSLTNVGLPISLQFTTPKTASPASAMLDCFVKTDNGWRIPLIDLQQAEVKSYINGNWRPVYCRVHDDRWESIGPDHDRVLMPWIFDVVISEDLDLMRYIGTSSEVGTSSTRSSGDLTTRRSGFKGLGPTPGLLSWVRKKLDKASYGDVRD